MPTETDTDTPFDPGAILFDPFIWRVVMAQIATLKEIDEHWTLCDLVDAHDALDIKTELEAHMWKTVKAGGK